jgi:hypothetical protein
MLSQMLRPTGLYIFRRHKDSWDNETKVTETPQLLRYAHRRHLSQYPTIGAIFYFLQFPFDFPYFSCCGLPKATEQAVTSYFLFKK